MIKAFRTYIQPIVQYGVLIYGSTTITTIREIDKVVKRIVQLIFHRKKFESTYEERVKHRIYLASELHAYEVLKQTLKNIRDNVIFQQFQSVSPAKFPLKKQAVD